THVDPPVHSPPERLPAGEQPGSAHCGEGCWGPNLKCARAGRSMQWGTQYFDVRSVQGQGQRRPANNFAVSKLSSSGLTLEKVEKCRNDGHLLLKVLRFNIIEELPELTNLTFLGFVVGLPRGGFAAVAVRNDHTGFLHHFLGGPDGALCPLRDGNGIRGTRAHRSSI